MFDVSLTLGLHWLFVFFFNGHARVNILIKYHNIMKKESHIIIIIIKWATNI